MADYDTQHPYPRNGQTPASTLARSVMYTNAADPNTIPGVITEEGYSTSTYGNGGNEMLQAHYQLDMLVDGAREGIAAQYIYDLVNSGDGFGLFNADNSATPTATEIHNLTSILSSSGTLTTPGSLNYSVSGLSSGGSSFLMEKANGAFDIAVWAEPGILNGTPPTQNVTVTLGATYGTVEIFDPTQGTAPIKTLSDVSSVQIAVTDHPVIIEVEPGSSQPPPPESLSVGNIGAQTENTAFTVRGTIANASGTPTLDYENDKGGFSPLPAGATVTATSFSFQDPGIATTGTIR